MLKNPYKIGFRTVKTAVGMTLGVIICKLLGLDNYASSAILVVLCIKLRCIQYKQFYLD